jgi:hypothetical protein
MPTITERFNAWRGSKADQEKNILDVANLLNDYATSVVDTEDGLGDINTKLDNFTTPLYKSIDILYKKPQFSAMLLCKLKIDQMLENIPSDTEEKKALTKIQQMLASIYEIRDNPKDAYGKLDELFQSIQSYLKLDSAQYADPKQAKEICFNFYLILKICHSEINHASAITKLGLKFAGGQEALLAKITPALNDTATRIKQFKPVDQAPTPPVKQTTVENKSIQEHLNDTYFSILTKTNNKIMVSELKKKLNEVSEGIAELMKLKKEKIEIDSEVRWVNNILNSGPYNKEDLKLVSLKDRANAINTEIEKLSKKIAGENEPLKQLLIQEHPKNLTVIEEANRSVEAGLDKFHILSHSFMKKQEWLHNLKSTHTEITNFIKKHDDFWVGLSNFFAQIHSCFKSDAAIMIDEAKKLQEDLSVFEQKYNKVIDKELEDIKNNADVPEAMKDKLISKFPSNEKIEVGSPSNASALKEFGFLREKHKKISEGPEETHGAIKKR